jgi:hypothetical protein
MSSSAASGPPSPPSEDAGVRAFAQATSAVDGIAAVDVTWTRLMRVVGRDVPASARLVNAAARKIGGGR